MFLYQTLKPKPKPQTLYSLEPWTTLCPCVAAHGPTLRIPPEQELESIACLTGLRFGFNAHGLRVYSFGVYD